MKTHYLLGITILSGYLSLEAQTPPSAPGFQLLPQPGLFSSLTEPACSYMSTENRKGFVFPTDPALAWIRGAHNGGSFPLRHFISKYRVINDTYGLFFYDPEGGYVAAFEKNYGFEFHGWKQGVMVVKSQDGTLWSALTGKAFEGPQTGKKLPRVPNLLTTWGHWLMLHPESTAYNLYDGNRYETVALPSDPNPKIRPFLEKADPRLAPLTSIIGVEISEHKKAYPLAVEQERHCILDTLNEQSIAIFWYGPTQSAVAFRTQLGDQTLTFRADTIAPETAPFMDNETQSRWTLAGRAVDGPLKGKELTWVDSIACRWYAWATEYPDTLLHTQAP